jgi:hypothetical protein
MTHRRPSGWLFLVCAGSLQCGTSHSQGPGSPADSGTPDAEQPSGDSAAKSGSDAATGLPIPDGGDGEPAPPSPDAGDSDEGTIADVGATPEDAASADDATSLPGRDACATGPLLAFPGAVGFGAAATGGRASAAYHVTQLGDTGAGSFRDAVSTGHRIVVFDVGGIINLASALPVAGDLTIAGQTAPGGGIAIEGREVSFTNSSNDIVRNVRFRQGTNDPDNGKSVIAADSSTLLIFDHVSIEFGQWDNLDVNSGMNVTLQRSIIANPIGQQFNAHCTSGRLSWYEDIFSSAHNRNPLAKGDTQYVNNVIYDFQAGYTAGNSAGVFQHDVVNNYFISGPATSNAGDAFFQVNDQSMYFEGNMLDSSADGTLNGSAMGFPAGAAKLTAPWIASTTSLATATAAGAYAYDIVHSGALPHDDVDSLVIADVTSLGKTGHVWTSQSQTNLSNAGYGTLAGGTPPTDTDGDGMPDSWEKANGLNPSSPSDAITEYGCTGYSNLEAYVNQLADSLL